MGLGFRVQGLGFRVQGSGFRVLGCFGFWALGFGFWVARWSLRKMAQGPGTHGLLKGFLILCVDVSILPL